MMLVSCTQGPSIFVFYPKPIVKHGLTQCNDLLSGDWKADKSRLLKKMKGKPRYIEKQNREYRKFFLRFNVNQICENSALRIGIQAPDRNIYHYLPILSLNFIRLNKSNFIQVVLKDPEDPQTHYALFKYKMRDTNTLVLYELQLKPVLKAIRSKTLTGKIIDTGRGHDAKITSTSTQFVEFIKKNEKKLFTDQVVFKRVQTQTWLKADENR
jgi:hypothetical protein